jgi:Mg-chelatase subunit ChlD
MTEENNSLTKQMPSPFAPAKRGIALQKEEARQILQTLDPLKCPNRLGLIFDDSGSMSGQAIQDAKTAVRNFLNSCKPTETSVAVFPLNQKEQPLICEYNVINFYLGSVNATGGTPLYEITEKMLNTTNITRGVAFSDGGSGDKDTYKWNGTEKRDETYYQVVIHICKAREIPIDCIFIGSESDRGYSEMKQFAADTGGIFIHFKDSTSLSQNLKYLTPGLRGLLANPDIKKRIEQGEKI